MNVLHACRCSEGAQALKQSMGAYSLMWLPPTLLLLFCETFTVLITGRSQVTSHPFLCDGLEDDVAFKRAASGDSELQMLIGSSGKMLLLAKLLPKLRAEGHKARARSQGLGH